MPFVALGALTTACYQSPIPDQSGFAALDDLGGSGQAVARLYVAPIPGIELIATHPWFVVKSASEAEFERWEVWPVAAEPFGHVRRDLFDLEFGVGAQNGYIIGELIGDDAEAVVDFLRYQSPKYSCRDRYLLLGPNSNTYAQWVLDNTGWNVELSAAAIGKDSPAYCP